jgi:predicted regulator of amino acid metabolism with ACT domain
VKTILKSELSVSCGSCDEEVSLDSSSSIAEKGMSYDVNRRAVYHSLETGGGYESLASFCSIMNNMPCISKTAYHKQLETILDELEQEAKEEMTNATKEVHESRDSEKPGDDGIVDAAVKE